MAEKSKPSVGAVAEAKRNPGGWVYEIRGAYKPDEYVPAHAVVGAWKVDDTGAIVGEFIPNPNFREIEGGYNNWLPRFGTQYHPGVSRRSDCGAFRTPKSRRYDR
jgi:hypothetical protein